MQETIFIMSVACALAALVLYKQNVKMLKINHDTGYWYFTIYRKGQWKFSRVGSRLWPCIVDTVKYLVRK